MSKKYSKDLDELIALVSYLSMTKYKSMRPSRLAQGLSLDESNVLRILNEYKAIFRKSQVTSRSSDEHYYTLHLRYALRWVNEDANQDNDDTVQENLPAEYLTTLLNFVVDRAALEETTKNTQIKNILTMIASVIAAIAAITAAVLSA